MRLRAIGIRGYEAELTEGKEYIAVNGKEPGIFENRPFVTIKGDNGKPTTCHLSRFEILEESK